LKPFVRRMKLESAESEPVRRDRTHSLEVILGLLPLVLGLQLIIWIVYLPVALRGNADFRNCYSAGYLVRSGQGRQIYNYAAQSNVQNTFISHTPTGMPYVHPAYEALLFAPLSFLSYRHAFLCWLGLNLGCLLFCHHILKKSFWRLCDAWDCFPALFLIGFAPVNVALLQGQDSLITLLLLSVALVHLGSRSDLSAGFLVGLAAYKFQLVLPVAFLFFFWRKWRFVSGVCLSALLAVEMSALISGTQNLFSYVSYVRETSVKFAILMPVERMPNLRGLVSLLLFHSSVGVAMILVLSLAIMALAGWSGRAMSAKRQFAIALSAAALVGYHVMTHDLSILLIPMAVIVDEDRPRELWIIPVVWLSVLLCFFGLDPFVAPSLLALFLLQALRSRYSTRGSPRLELSEATRG
jgi:Glycosyltransferase family 87